MPVPEQWDKKFIGDEITIKGRTYYVTANYPKHGYLIASPRKIAEKTANSSLKLKYA